MPKLKSGCHNCSRRRVKCDEKRPQCNKCRAQGLECAGYGIEVRFIAGVATRGRYKGLTVPSVKQAQRTPHHLAFHQATALVWPDGSLTGNTNSEQEVAAPLAEPTPDELDNYWNDASDAMIPSFNTVEQFLETGFSDSEEPGYVEAVAECSTNFNKIGLVLDDELSRINCDRSQAFGLYSPSQALISLAVQTRELFAHFSDAIAPVMVVFDGKFNGYRDLILPMAVEDDLVKQAVSVVSMYHLAPQREDLQTSADARLQAIIRDLRHRVDTFKLSDVSAWTTILVLLTGETVSGGTNLPYLFKLLQHLQNANRASGQNSSIHSFLKEQSLMMTLFAQPLLDEAVGTSTLAAVDSYLGFISNAAIFFPTLVPQINLLISAIRQACNIYVTRATIGPPHSTTVNALEELRQVCLQIPPYQPGHHALVWAYFIAAAESSTYEHRDFFTQRLKEIYSKTKFLNIPAALTTLQILWKRQSQRRWTESLAADMPVFII